jgi:hypothetical protein
MTSGRTAPAVALQKARELRDFAEKARDQEYVRKADEMAQTLETYLAGALNLKTKADGLEKEGKLRDAALLIDRLLSEYPNTDPARYALYPIEIVTRPAGVRVTSIRSGIVIGETGDASVRYRMKPTESVRLLFEKAGYASVERDVKDKSVGRIQVELTDKREQWILPLGVSVSTPPQVMGEMVLVTGGSRIFSLRANPKRVDWYESLDGQIEGRRQGRGRADLRGHHGERASSRSIPSAGQADAVALRGARPDRRHAGRLRRRRDRLRGHQRPLSPRGRASSRRLPVEAGDARRRPRGAPGAGRDDDRGLLRRHDRGR